MWILEVVALEKRHLNNISCQLFAAVVAGTIQLPKETRRGGAQEAGLLHAIDLQSLPDACRHLSKFYQESDSEWLCNMFQSMFIRYQTSSNITIIYIKMK